MSIRIQILCILKQKILKKFQLEIPCIDNKLEFFGKYLLTYFDKLNLKLNNSLSQKII